MRKIVPFLTLWLILACMLAGCATSPTGRTQLAFFSQKQLARMGQESHERMAQKVPVAEDPAVNRYVRCTVDTVAASLPGSVTRDEWRVTVSDQDGYDSCLLPAFFKASKSFSKLTGLVT